MDDGLPGPLQDEVVHEFRVRFSEYSFSENVRLREPVLNTSHTGKLPPDQAPADRSGAGHRQAEFAQGMRDNPAFRGRARPELIKSRTTH